MVDRLVGCAHWAGEEPDAQREKQIRKALKELKCDRLDRDYQAMMKLYAKQPKVLDALKRHMIGVIVCRQYAQSIEGHFLSVNP